jgi:carboxyl-terminal processing protease
MLSMAIILVENSSKTKINKLDFIDNEYVDNINTDSIVNITVDNI